MPAHPTILGPRELLVRAVSSMSSEAEADARISLILVDAAVELTLRTFLETAPGDAVSLAQRRELSVSFSGLVDATRLIAGARLDGFDFLELEWHHAQRQAIYRRGTGLRVKVEQLEVYAELAQILFEQLFGEAMGLKDPRGPSLLGQFLVACANLEKMLVAAVARLEIGTPAAVNSGQRIRELEKTGLVAPQLVPEIEELLNLRHRLGYGDRAALDAAALERLSALCKELNKSLGG